MRLPLLSPRLLGDGIVDENEVTDGVQILVTLPSGTEVGDTVEIALVMPNGQTVESEHTVPFTWSPGQTLPITLPAFLDGEYDVTAQVSKSDGSQSPVSQPAEFTLDARDDAPDLTPLQTPSISVNEAGADGLINGTESADGVQVQVYLPDQITQGDSVELMVTLPNGGTFTVNDQVVDNTGVIEMTIPAIFGGRI